MYSFSCSMGLDTIVMIGVKKGDSKLAGHGWIEIEGTPYLENKAELEKYTVMLKG